MLTTTRCRSCHDEAITHDMKKSTGLNIETLVTALLGPESVATQPNQLLIVDGIEGRRDSLTDIQQKILSAAISLIHETGENDPGKTVYPMAVDRFLQICNIDQRNLSISLPREIEKLLKKGVWLHEENKGTLTRTAWFQAVWFSGGEIVFQFSEKILPVIFKLSPDDAEYTMVKGIQYRGRHTRAIFNMIWQWKGKGITEYSIPQLMRQLSLEHTRYSYGQLKLRVLEPSFEEIYACDDAIFIRFGPTYSGRRVEGVWFEVTVGAEAGKMRKKEPEFKVALPDQKPVK